MCNKYNHIINLNLRKNKCRRLYMEKLISAEMGKLWATYMGNSMSTCILSYFLKHVEDQDIKKLLENALNLSKEFQKIIKGIF